MYISLVQCTVHFVG